MRRRCFFVEKKTKETTVKPAVLTIAGSDSSGGAGIQADLKAFAANGIYGASVITAITAQNTTGVFAIHPLDADIVRAQLEAVFSDLNVIGVKIGMVADQQIMRVIADAIKKYQPQTLIVDPVMVSTTGHTLLKPDQIDTLKATLLPLATLITPNLQEAEVLLGRSITTFSQMQQAANVLAETFETHVLLKGGHFPLEQDGKRTSVDILSTGVTFTSDWIDSGATHGTGCSLSAAICATMAKGQTLNDAIQIAKNYVHRGIAQAYPVGCGSQPIHHFHTFWEV